MTAKFITFEGGEGTGKSTQARRLVERLTATGRACVTTREPGGTPFAEKVRALVLSAEEPRSALSEALLFSAARADHVERLIRPSLESGSWVVCDRFSDSTRAYQGAAGGVPADVLAELEALAVGPTRPDLTIVLDLPPTTGLARAVARRRSTTETDAEPDAFEARLVGFHERLRQGFLDIADREPERCVVVDADAQPDVVAAVVWAHVCRRLLPEAL